MLFEREVTKESLETILTALRKGSQEVTIDSPGGDYLAAMDFIKTVRKEGLVKNLSFKIVLANSAAAYIVLALQCPRTLTPGGRIIVHGGKIEAELIDFFLSSLGRKTKAYLDAIMKILREIVTPERVDTFTTSYTLELTREECVLAGITVLKPGGSPT